MIFSRKSAAPHRGLPKAGAAPHQPQPPLSRLALGRGNDPRRGSIELAARKARKP